MSDIEKWSKRKVLATARVQVTVEVVCSSWGADCSVAQVYAQAEDEAMGAVGNLCAEAKGRVRLVGNPKVTMVTTEEQR